MTSPLLPDPDQRIVVKGRKAVGVIKGDPWIHRNAVIAGPEAAGVFPVVTDEDRPLGHADWNPAAAVRGRMLWREAQWPGEVEWLDDALRFAIQRRLRLGFSAQGGGIRLVNGEGDGLPGLVMDLFGADLVIDCHTAAMRRRLEHIDEVLDDILPDSVRHRRMSRDAARREGCEPLAPESGELRFVENGVSFAVDLGADQKTGFYLDQRENRRLAGTWASERRVLDAFCYHGAFGLTCAAAGAADVVAIDSSEPALAAGRANAERNHLDVSFEKADVFDALDRLAEGDPFDLVICDPPKLAPKRSDRRRALGAYRFLADRCLRLLEPGGILMVSSCSSAIDGEDLRQLLEQVAAKRRMLLDVIAVTGHPADHPWPVCFREGRYLATIAVELRALW